MSILKGTEEQIIDTAAQFLLNGDVVAIPTETVYGLAADITQENAIAKIYQLKKRPINHPLIIHISNETQLARYTKNIPDYAIEFIRHFWPGPLTLVLKKSDYVSHAITGQQDTVAIRMPSHALTLTLIEKVGRGLAAPSANQFGRISPTQAQHVIEELGNSIPIIDGGECAVGIESTIINATNPNFFSLLRPGHITLNDLMATLKHHPNVEIKEELSNIKISGRLEKHYAPQKPLVLFSTLEELKSYKEKFKIIYIIHYSKFSEESERCRKVADYPSQFAREIYSALRLADQSTAYAIAIERPPKDPAWHAISDRLKKSAAGSG